MRAFHFAIAVLAGSLAATAFPCAPLRAKALDLPATAPLPVPSPVPDEAGPQALPAEAPVPTPRPGDAGKSGKAAPKPDPRSAETAAERLPPEEAACRERLRAAGVAFAEHAAERDEAVGCSLPYPVVVAGLSPSVALTPKAELDCAMAEAAARFVAGVAAPAARKAFGKEIGTVEQVSAYVCRPRHNGAKLSEHAFGNALDIGAFVLADGTRIEVGPSPPAAQASFLAELRKAACGPFKTVLGPGSDPDHERHFHLDLEPRRHGGTFCQ